MANDSLQKLLAAPSTVSDGRGSYYIIHPLSWREFEFLRSQEVNGVPSIEVGLYTVWLSVRKEQPGISRWKVAKLFRSRKRQKMLVAILSAIYEISFPTIELKDKKDSTSKANAGQDTNALLVLSNLHGWTPDQIANMTPYQIYSYCHSTGASPKTRKAGSTMAAKSLKEAQEMLNGIKGKGAKNV